MRLLRLESFRERFRLKRLKVITAMDKISISLLSLSNKSVELSPMISETLNYCEKCGFTYVVLDSSAFGSTIEINQCLIDGSMLEKQMPESALAAKDYFFTEKYDTSYYHIVYPQIKLTEVVTSDGSNLDIIQSRPYEDKVNNQIKEQFLGQVDKSKEAPDYKGHAGWDFYNGRVIGGFGFKLENHSVRIIHYTGQAHSQMSMIDIEDIFSVDLGFVPEHIKF